MKILQKAYRKLYSIWHFPGEKILAEGPLEIEVEWFDDEGKDYADKNYAGVYLTRSKHSGWYNIYDIEKNERYRLNDSHIELISWVNMATGDSGYHKTTNRGRNVLEKDTTEAN